MTPRQFSVSRIENEDKTYATTLYFRPCCQDGSKLLLARWQLLRMHIATNLARYGRNADVLACPGSRGARTDSISFFLIVFLFHSLFPAGDDSAAGIQFWWCIGDR